MAGQLRWHGLQNHAQRHADDPPQLRQVGRRLPRRTNPSQQRELLRDNGLRRGQHRGHGFQNEPQREADHPLQLPQIPVGTAMPPYAGLVQASDGNFYGTTFHGAGQTARRSCGTVFKITPSGTLTTLYSFCSQNCPDAPTPRVRWSRRPMGTSTGRRVGSTVWARSSKSLWAGS